MFQRISNSFKERINKPLLYVSFIFYLIILIWITIFKLNMLSALGNSLNKMIYLNAYERFMNQFMVYSISFDGLDFLEIILNILIFVPFTLFLPLLFNKIDFKRDIMLTFIFFSLIETFQLVVGLGGFEFLDIATNMIGGCLGCFIFKSLKPCTSNKIINFISLTITIIFLPVVLYAIVNTAIHYDYYVPFFDGTSLGYLLSIKFIRVCL